MTNETWNLLKLFAACWKDHTLKARFMNDPASILVEYDMEIPDSMNVNVVENNASTVHITIPLKPTNYDDLSLQELEVIGGGIEDGSKESSTWLCQSLDLTECIRKLVASHHIELICPIPILLN